MKLKRAQFYVGKSKAQSHVVHLARTLTIPIPKPRDFGIDVQLKNESKTFCVNFSKEIEHTVKHGKANMLQTWFDAGDRFLQPAIEMSASSSVPGLAFTLSSSLGSHSETVSNHGVLESPELALARDICFFHKETCDQFNAGDVQGFSRNFRGFLHSCVSLVDCFLFRYAFHVKDAIGDLSKFKNTSILDSRAGVSERLDAWMLTFAAQESAEFKGWKERAHFMELKGKRNEFTHPCLPSVSYEPGEITKYLNYGATGVGGLLGRMRRASAETDRIGFIHQVAHLPEITLLRND